MKGLGAMVSLLLIGCTALPVPCASLERASEASLKCRALGGDQSAALELGRLYEQGTGTPIDLVQAEHFYRLAASSDTGQRFIYLPPVGSSKVGKLIPANLAPQRQGSAEAKRALAALRLRMARTTRQLKRACDLVRSAGDVDLERCRGIK